MSDHHEPLTPEEAALAQRLARLGPHGEPSPALDARVLAAARAADEARAPLRRHRWPAALGVAASVVLAVGIAWQLRPGPAPREEVPMATPTRDAVSPVAEVVQPATPPQAAEATVEAARAPVAEPAPPARRRMAAPATGRAAPAAVPLPPPPPEPPVVFDEPSPMAMPLPAPPPAPAAQSQAKQAVATPPPSPEAARAATAEDPAFDAAVAADRAADAPEADVPPATADAPAVREAWLQRIRELVAAGEADAARASLREFVRRHPDEPLPDDLRPLLR